MIRRRNMWLQALWMILTLGFYMFYWFYATTKEMAQYLGRDEEVGLWTFLFVLPLIQAYPMYKQGELYELISNRGVNRWVMFMLWMIFPPAVWVIVQMKLNELADQGTAQPTTQASATAAPSQ